MNNLTSLEYTQLLDQLLKTASDMEASDIHLKPYSKVFLRVKGELVPVGEGELEPEAIRNIIYATMSPEQIEYVQKHKEIDYAYSPNRNGNDSRYRVNAYMAQNELEAVLRVIKAKVAKTEELNLPPVIDKLAVEKYGLVLVAGATGQGKSTTLGAMIDKINNTANKRIITIENPVEILHTDNQSVISQREVGGDTTSFASALRSILRQNPDVILIGEIRDRETAEIALQAAQTGHLVLSTIHAGSSEETIKRFAGLYPIEERANVKRVLASVIRGIVSQRLIVAEDGSRFPVMEVMVNTHRINQALLQSAEGEDGESITKIISDGGIYGMNTLDQYLIKMLLNKRISMETALAEANQPLAMRQELHRRGFNLEQ